jgi:alpha-tubulin suppressor-like RCC1 family protein
MLGFIQVLTSNAYSQLGNFQDKTITHMDVASGSSHSCVLLSSGGVKCWELYHNGCQVGDNTTTSPRRTPVFVVGLGGGVVSVVSGDSHSCAILSTGGLKCWGANSYGQIGDGTTTRRCIPVSVVGLGSGVCECCHTSNAFLCHSKQWRGRVSGFQQLGHSLTHSC